MTRSHHTPPDEQLTMFDDVWIRNIGSFYPYSSDVASCDFNLFLKRKEFFGGKRFTEAEKTVAASEKALEIAIKEEWANCVSQ